MDEASDSDSEATPPVHNQDIQFAVDMPQQRTYETMTMDMIDQLQATRPQLSVKTNNKEKDEGFGMRTMRSPSKDHGTPKSSLLKTEAFRRPSQVHDPERRISIALDVMEDEQKHVTNMKSPSRLAFHVEDDD